MSDGLLLDEAISVLRMLAHLRAQQSRELAAVGGSSEEGRNNILRSERCRQSVEGFEQAIRVLKAMAAVDNICVAAYLDHMNQEEGKAVG